MKKLHFILIIVSCLVLSSFKRSSSPDEFITCFLKNQFDFQKSFNDKNASYTLIYFPNELQYINALKNNLMTENEALVWLKESRKRMTFNLKIELTKSNLEFLKFDNDSLNYEQKINYYSFYFLNDIEIFTDNKKKLKVENFHFERNFGTSRKGDFTFSIDVPKKYRKMEVIITDKIIGTQKVYFEFEREKINALPKLIPFRKWKKQ
jgi:hypothetical protein